MNLYSDGMSTSPPPPAPAPLSLDLTTYAEAVNKAFYNQAVAVIATSNGSDVDLALKGSFMVWDQDHLALTIPECTRVFGSSGRAGRGTAAPPIRP